MPIVYDDEKKGSSVIYDNTTNIRDTVAQTFSPEGIQPDQAERAKTLKYLEIKGYGVSDATADNFRTMLFSKDSSWGAINKQLANELSVQPLGPVKRAGMSLDRTSKWIQRNMDRPAPDSMEWIDKNTIYPQSNRERLVRAMDAGNTGQYKSILAGMPEAEREQVIHDFGKSSQALNIVEKLPAFVAMGNVVAAQKIPETLIARYPQVSAKVILAIARSLSAAEVLAPIGAVEGAARAGVKGAIEGAAGGAAMGAGFGLIGGLPVVAREIGTLAAFTAMNIAGGMDTPEAIATAVAELLLFNSLGFNPAKRIDQIRLNMRAKQAAKASTVPDGGTSFSGTRMVNVGGKMVPVEQLRTNPALKQQYAREQVGKVFGEEHANDIFGAKDTSIISGVKVQDGKPLQNQSGGKYLLAPKEMKLLDAGLVPTRQFLLPEKVTGFNGGPITQDDLATYRNKEGFIETLDDSPESVLLKKAITENDGSALAEYNQGLVGVAEEAPAIEAPTQEAPKSAANITTESADMIEQSAMIKRDETRILEAIGSEYSFFNEPLTDKQLLSNVRSSGMVDNAVDIARKLIESKAGHTKEEHVAMYLAVQDKLDVWKELESLKNDAALKGEDISQYEIEQKLISEDVETIMIADKQSGSPVGSALRIRRLKFDPSYDEPSVRGRAAVVKERPLTQQEFASIQKNVEELAQWEELAKSLQKDIEALQARTSADIAEQAVKEISEAKTDRKKGDARQRRIDAKEKLREMGLRVNDISGLTVEGAKLISDIAVSYIEEGAVTLKEVINKVQNDLPDASEKNIYDALGGRVKRAVEKTRTEAQNTIAELKTQARLQGEIMDAMEGILDPTRAKKVSSKEVSDLRKKLAEYKASIVNTERDAIRVNEILDRISQIDDMAGRAYKPTPVIRTKTADLIEAEKMLRTANAELSAKNRIALLEEMLRDETASIQKTKEKTESSKRLEEFRTRIKILQDQIGDKKKEATRIEREKKQAEKDRAETELIALEVQQAFRRMREQKQTKVQKDADLKLIRSRQDKIFDLIDRVNGNEPAKKIQKVQIEDSEGYLGMITELKAELSEKRAIARAEEAKKNRELRADEKIKSLTDEVEKFIRDIPKPVVPKEKTGREDAIKALNESKRQQDKIADLLEVIRNKTVPEKVAKAEKEDPNGYLNTIKNLRAEIKNSEWYQEWKKISGETQKLLRTEADIKEFERRIAENDYEGFVTPKKERIILDQRLADAELKKFQLKREIEKRIRAMKPKTLSDYFWEAYDIPRNLKLTFDMGHIGLQGGIINSNPLKLFKYGNAAFQALGSQEKADIIEYYIENGKHYQDALDHGLGLIGEGSHNQAIERIIQASFLDRVPVVGKGTTAFARSQLPYTNLLRYQEYADFLERNPNISDEDKTKFAEQVNIMTGKGVGRWVDQNTHWMNKFLTSWSYTASRMEIPFQLLRPSVIRSPKVWQWTAKRQAEFVASRMLWMLLLSRMFPDDMRIGSNPDHSTFGCLIVDVEGGMSRVYDPWAGMRAVVQTGQKILTGQGSNALEPIGKFLTNKVTPSLAAFYNTVFGRKFPNQDIPRFEAFMRSALPISMEGVIDDIVADTGTTDLVFANILNFIGINSYVEESDKLDDKTEWMDRNSQKEDKAKPLFSY